MGSSRRGVRLLAGLGNHPAGTLAALPRSASDSKPQGQPRLKQVVGKWICLLIGGWARTHKEERDFWCSSLEMVFCIKECSLMPQTPCSIDSDVYFSLMFYSLGNQDISYCASMLSSSARKCWCIVVITCDFAGVDIVIVFIYIVGHTHVQVNFVKKIIENIHGSWGGPAGFVGWVSHSWFGSSLGSGTVLSVKSVWTLPSPSAPPAHVSSRSLSLK